MRRMSSKNTPFATAQMRAAGEDGEPVWCSCIAFSTEAVDALLALRAGDAVAIAGIASLNHWETSSGEYRVDLRVRRGGCCPSMSLSSDASVRQR